MIWLSCGSSHKPRPLRILDAVWSAERIEVTMDVASSVIPLLNFLWIRISREAHFLSNFKENLENLIRKRDELVPRANSVIREVHRAELEGKIPTYETEEWLKHVEEVNKEVTDAEEQFVAIDRFSKVCFPSCNMRRKLSKNALKLTVHLVELMDRSPFVGGVAVDQLPVVGHILPTISLVGETTAKTTLESLWKWAIEKNIGKIGVHGMGGVGKTTIMKHINNRLKESQLFDSIIWVTVSKPFSLDSLQDDVAQAIGLDISQEINVDRRSAMLFAALNLRKKFVLILDDMWEAFPLEHIGIPQPSIENCCKILLTTRSVQVCREMETDENIKVGLLSEKEAWELFKDKIGGNPVLSPDIESIAKQVAKQCGCLPLAIVTVGRALRQVDDIRVWRHTLATLEGLTNDIKVIKKDVFMPLRFSYDHLKSEVVQACFLCCALFPEDYKIPTEDLIEYWMGEGLIREIGNRQAEVDKGHAMLNDLKNAYMLEGMTGILGQECVWMHDLIRDMAVHIMQESNSFMVRAGVGLKKSPKEEDWLEDYERISLMENNIDVMSCQPKCPKLSMLLLRRNPLSQITEDSFFMGMNNLKVLDLSHTLINSLPESISELVNLRTLLLSSCRKLKNVPSMEKLKELRVFDMSHTPIDKLPHGTEGLVKLRRLDLSYTENLKMFPTGLLSRLPHLEDLSTYRSSWLWLSRVEEVEGGAGIEEIISLVQLTDLRLSFWNLDTFVKYVSSGHWQMLKSFNLMVGWKSALWYSKSKYSIEIVSEELLNLGSSLLLPSNTVWLHIENCHDIFCLSGLSCLSKLSNLRDCSVYTCKGIECLVVENGNHLSSIETLNLWNLPNLSSLCRPNTHPASFKELRTLEIGSCDKLKSIFSLSMLQHLQKLEEVRVMNSFFMEEIISGEEMIKAVGITSVVTLPSLKMLDLKYLPALTNIYCGDLRCNSLTAITVEKCPKLKRLPISIDHVPPMLVIKGDKEWLDALWHDDTNSRAIFQNHFKEC